jgi:hypothetical protein
VVFLQEVWFAVQNTPALASRYEKHALFALFFFVVSVAARLVKNRFFSSSSRRRTALTWLSRTSLALTGLAFVLAFIDLVKNRLPFDDLVCTDVAVDAYYHSPRDQSYELIQRERCFNRTDHSVRNYADLRDGYYEKIPHWQVTPVLLSCTARVKFAPIVRTDEERRNDIGGARTLYFYRESAEFDPPLPSGSSYDLEYEISARGVPVDAAAFSNEGTVFYRGVDYDTLNYYLTIHAPSGYFIEMTDWGVFDSAGAKLSEETGRQKEPHVSVSGSLLEWRVSPARRHIRYMLKYRITSYADR